MTINPPSQKWVSQRLAVLESVANIIEKRVNLLGIPYFFAVGLYLQLWVDANFSKVYVSSAFDGIAFLACLLVMVLLGPALLTLALMVRMIRNRA